MVFKIICATEWYPLFIYYSYDDVIKRRHFPALLVICAGNSPVPSEFPARRPVTRSFDVFFDLRLNTRLSKQWWGWWSEMPSRPLWRHRNGLLIVVGVMCGIHSPRDSGQNKTRRRSRRVWVVWGPVIMYFTPTIINLLIVRPSKKSFYNLLKALKCSPRLLSQRLSSSSFREVRAAPISKKKRSLDQWYFCPHIIRIP